MFAFLTGLIDRCKHRPNSRSEEVRADRDGVIVVRGDETVLLRFFWADVTEIRTFKRDMGTVDDIRLALQAGESWYELSEDLRGFSRLSDTMMEVFSTIPRDWYMEVMQPPFATNERVLFRRSAGPGADPGRTGCEQGAHPAWSPEFHDR
jgi:hypothetical protein